jgi:t-SNARE complex subunit (syntaxin)
MQTDLLSSFQEHNPKVGHAALKLGRRKVSSQLPELNLAFVHKLREIHQAIRLNLKGAHQQRRVYLANNDQMREPKIKQTISFYFSRVTSDISRAENLLKLARRTHEEGQAAAKDFGNNDGGLRIVGNLIAALQNDLVGLVTDFNRLQNVTNSSYKEKMVRQIRTLSNDITDDEVQQLLKKPEEFKAFVEEKLYGGKKAIQNVVSDIDEKLAEIRELEASMDKLLGMIRSLHRLVTQQNKVVESIEATVSSVVDHVEKTHAEMEQGKKYMASAKEKAWIFFAAVTFLVVILLNKILNSLTS